MPEKEKTKITHLEEQGILGIAASDYQTHVNGSGSVWSFSVCGDFTNVQRSGIISSLSKKGLVHCYKEKGEDEVVMLSDEGLIALKEIRWKNRTWFEKVEKE